MEENSREYDLRRAQAKRSWQYIAGVLGVVLFICLIVLIMQLDDRNTQIQDGAQTVSQLKNENGALVTENQKLKADSKALISENQTLQKQLTDKNRQIERDTNTISELKAANKALVTENQDLRRQLADLVAININTASVEELQKLPNIGPKRAQAIVQYRESQGNFTSVEDITKIPGIGEKTLEKLRPFIRVK